MCDQATYDEVYRRIIQIAVTSELSVKDIKERNDAIENLRKLCNGQHSSYEVQLRSAKKHESLATEPQE